MELRHIASSGHSLLVTLPKAFLAALKLRKGDVVALELVDDTIVVSRAVSARGFAANVRHAGEKRTG